MKIIDTLVERQQQTGLRTIDEETGGALCGAGLEEGRDDIAAARPDREDRTDRDIVLQVCRTIERIERDTDRRVGVQDFRQLRLLGHQSGDGRFQQRIAHHAIGGDVDVLLRIAVGIGAAGQTGHSGQRPRGDQPRKILGGRGKRLDHGNRGGADFVAGVRREAGLQCRTVVHGSLPCHLALFAGPDAAAPHRCHRGAINARFAQLGKFQYLWERESISYGWREWLDAFPGI